MAYQIKHHESLALEVRRIAHAEARAAMLAARRARALPEAVHAVRSHCKRARALLRLVKKGLGDVYRTENRAYRNIARGLSAFRDAEVMRMRLREAVESATNAHRDFEFEPLSARLAAELARELSDQATLAALSATREPLSSCLQRIDSWRLKGKAASTVSAGLCATFEKARALMLAAASSQDPRVFHEWRRHAKYHWLQLKLVRPISSRLYPGRMKRMSELSHGLGTLHDLDVLEAWLVRARKKEPAASVLVRRVSRRRSDLSESTLILARPLFEQAPKEFVAPIRKRWAS